MYPAGIAHVAPPPGLLNVLVAFQPGPGNLMF